MRGRERLGAEVTTGTAGRFRGAAGGWAMGGTGASGSSGEVQEDRPGPASEPAAAPEVRGYGVPARGPRSEEPAAAEPEADATGAAAAGQEETEEP